MARAKQSKGKCAYCGQEMAKSGMIKHLSTCAKRQELLTSIERKKGDRETLYHLRVQDSWKKGATDVFTANCN